MTDKTHFLVILTSLNCSQFFSETILDSASLDSATKSDLQATGIDLKNSISGETTLENNKWLYKLQQASLCVFMQKHTRW